MIADNPPKKNDVFICHAREDAGLALAMCSFLEKKGFRCWEASRDIQPGRDYAASIISAIQSSAVMVVILSKNANTSNHVRIEVERAFKNEANILPFRIEDVQPEQALEYYLGAYQWLDALEETPQSYFDDLARNCAALLGRDLPVAPPKTDEAPKPPVKSEPPTVLKPVAEVKPAIPAPIPEKPSEEKPVVPSAPAPPPVVEQNRVTPPPPPVWPNQQPPFMPPGPRGNSSKKPLIFTVAGIAALIIFFFVYKSTLQKHAIWFKNNTLTPVYIELDGNLTKIPLGDSVEYRAKNKYRLQTKASTYVLKADGGVLGQNLEWHIDTSVSSWHNITYPLQIGPDYFLLKMINNSSQNMIYLKVSSGQTDYSYSFDVTVPNDGRTYNLGYYRTLSDLTVIARNGDQQGWEWDCGRDFHYPNLWNQWVRVTKN